jgi:FKBP-type peptidyl-prolyl cis-trans isomerase
MYPIMKKTIINLCLGLVVLAGFAGCNKTSTVDSSQTFYETNDTDLANYVSQNKLTTTKTNSGLQYVVTTANLTGKTPAVNEEVAFTYKTTIISGTAKGNVVDTASLKTPLYYTFGLGFVLSGLEEGLSKLREGESATLLLPSYLAFGNNARSNIPAYSNLRFDVTLLRSRTEDQQIEDYLAINKLTVTEKTTTGLRFIKTKDNAAGAPLVANQTAVVKYAGKLIRSTANFDSGDALNVTLGQNQVIPGFEEGIRKLKVGEKATIIMPSSIGYGSKGVTNSSNVYVITPYAPLVFDIEIVSVK